MAWPSPPGTATGTCGTATAAIRGAEEAGGTMAAASQTSMGGTSVPGIIVMRAFSGICTPRTTGALNQPK